MTNISEMRTRRAEVARALAFLEADEQAYNKGLGDYIEDLRAEYLLLCCHIKKHDEELCERLKANLREELKFDVV